MPNELKLIPSYWASVSGGKDSLFMLNMLLNNPERYPLDGVVHFELEIDYPFIKNVVDFMAVKCAERGVKFVRIKPRKTWEELYNRYGFPTRRARWCNSKYKLDAAAQHEAYMKSIGYEVHSYIGFCADELNRIDRRKSDKEHYPLYDFGILEGDILKWARNVPEFNNFYKSHIRCGCIYCPMLSMMDAADLYKYYPDNFNYMLSKMRQTEIVREMELGRPFSCYSSNPKYNANYLEHIVTTKWIYKLNAIEEMEV